MSLSPAEPVLSMSKGCDIGAAFNVGGHLTQLRRTRISPHTLASAVTLDQLNQDGLAPHLRTIA